MSAPSISGLGLPFLLHKIEQMSFTRSQSVQRIVENPLTSTNLGPTKSNLPTGNLRLCYIH